MVSAIVKAITMEEIAKQRKTRSVVVDLLLGETRKGSTFCAGLTKLHAPGRHGALAGVSSLSKQARPRRYHLHMATFSTVRSLMIGWQRYEASLFNNDCLPLEIPRAVPHRAPVCCFRYSIVHSTCRIRPRVFALSLGPGKQLGKTSRDWSLSGASRFMCVPYH